MRRYETIYILRPSLSEEEITKIIESSNQIILDESGTIIDLNKWGMKKLAYLIHKETQGYYIYCDYAGTPAVVSEIERKFRIDDSVLRYMTIKTSASISAEQIELAVGAVTARETAAQETVAEETEAQEKKTVVTEKAAAQETTSVTEKAPVQQAQDTDKGDDAPKAVTATEE